MVSKMQLSCQSAPDNERGSAKSEEDATVRLVLRLIGRLLLPDIRTLSFVNFFKLTQDMDSFFM